MDLTTGLASIDSPGLTLKGSEEISNVTLYVGIIDSILENTSLSSLVWVKLENGSISNVNSWSPSGPDHSTEKDSKDPVPDGETGCMDEKRSLPISTPSAYNTASISESVLPVPEFSMNAEICTFCPGLGEVGSNSIPLPSSRGLISGLSRETTVDPMTISNVLSPSISAKEGDDHVR